MFGFDNQSELNIVCYHSCKMESEQVSYFGLRTSLLASLMWFDATTDDFYLT